MGFGNIINNSMNRSVENEKRYSKGVSSTKGGIITKTEQTGLSQLAPGKVFAGEVVSVSKDKVLLKLDNGQTIQAAANSDVQLVEGQKIAFMVKSNNGKQLAIKPMFEVASNNSSILKALQDAGVAVNQKNTELVQLLMSEQLPIDKDTIIKFLRQMKAYPDVSAKTLVDLQKMGQPVTKDNIARLQGYQNHQYPLAGELISTAFEVADFIAEGVKIEGTAGLDAFSRMIDTIFVTEDKNLLSMEMLKENIGINEREPFKALHSDMPVLYDNLKSETMLSGAKVGLTEIQQQALDNLDFVTGRYEGQEVEMNHILEGMKILNDEAEIILKDIKENMQNPLSKAGKGDVMTRLLAAFEMYETAEKSMAKAKSVLGGEEFKLLSPENLKNENGGNSKPVFDETVLKGLLDEHGRNVLAQKIYKVTGDISQYFQVRAGEMSPEEFVRMVNDMLPKEVAVSEENGQMMEFSKVIDGKSQEILANPGEDLTAREAKVFQENAVKVEGFSNLQEQKNSQVNVTNPETVSSFQEQKNLQVNTTNPEYVSDLQEQKNPFGDAIKSEEFSKLQEQKNPLENAIKSENPSYVQEGFYSPEVAKEATENPIVRRNAQQIMDFNENVTGEKILSREALPEKVITRILNESMMEKLPELKDLIQCDEFKEVLQKAVETRLLLNPEEVTKENVKAYYEKLDFQMEKLHEIANELGKQDNGVLKNTSSIRQNVDYMNQLNQLYSYVQIPLKLSGQNANSELYVMKNKKNKRENKESFTALLHLDMEKMGSMDIFITMERKKVAVRFYVEKTSTAMFLEENHGPFVEKLGEKGFQITAEFEMKPEEKNMVEEFTKGEVEAVFENKYSFDIRT